MTMFIKKSNVCADCHHPFIGFMLISEMDKSVFCNNCFRIRLQGAQIKEMLHIKMYDENEILIRYFSKFEFLSINPFEIFCNDISRKNFDALKEFQFPIELLELRVKNLLYCCKVEKKDFKRNKPFLSSSSYCHTEDQRQLIIESVKDRITRNLADVKRHQEMIKSFTEYIYQWKKSVSFYKDMPLGGFRNKLANISTSWENPMTRINGVFEKIKLINKNQNKFLDKCIQI